MPDAYNRYAVNCSIIFTELPLHERFAAARSAGFGAVELWWPFAEPVPDPAEVASLEDAIRVAGVRLTGLNFFAGDMPGGDRGVLSWPAESAAFRENVGVAVGIGERLGCRVFNALYGNRLDDIDHAVQDAVARENLAFAANAVARIDGTVVVEPISGAARYPLLTAADAIAVIDQVAIESGATNLALLADLYHLAVNGQDPSAEIATYAARIGHVQIADSPGRNEPGVGELDLPRYLAELDSHGYTGMIGLEYKPSGASADSFGWVGADATGGVR